MTFVVIGDLMLDVVAELSAPLAHGSDTPARIVRRGGGSAANVAAWLAEVGMPVAWVGRVGDEADAADLAAAGVDVRAAVDRERATGTCVVLVEPGGERTMVPDPGANAALAPDDLPAELFAPGRHLHLTGYTLLREATRPAGLRALAHARERGMTISVDPPSAAPLAAAGPRAFLDWVGEVDLLLPNAAEAGTLAPGAGARPLAEALAPWARAIAVKRGPAGADWLAGGCTVERVAAAAVPVVDTTGAGDAFAAGVLSARRAGDGPRAALEAGCALAARAVAQTGARPPLRSPR